MTECVQPGCHGTIAEDGYCDECGRAVTSSSTASSAVPSGPATAASGPAAHPSPPGTSGSETPGSETPGSGRTGPTGSRSTGTGSTSSGQTGSGRPYSGRTASGGTASGGTGSGRTGSGRSRSTTSRRHIGAGLVEITAAPRRDPAEAVMADPQVPERHRYCGRCGAEVGRSRGDRQGRAQGFCPNCGTRFSFVPTLAPGDVVAGQYEILGCLAHGGLGWIYLALDRAVDDRWVVLKGLIDTGDEAAMAAAIAERGFLAGLVHPRIVRIYNMVQAGAGNSAGYIVMEYVDGESLRRKREPRTPMPPDEALAFVIEVLPALAHMHEQELLYCDFKPDNVVQTGTEVKLIDLGAVRRMDDPGGDVWGTVGYQAPEIRPDGPGPSIASDVYTVGRALAVLVTNFDFARRYVDRLPDAADAPALAEHDGLRRLLERATAHDPTRRFASIPELSEQMIGVLRQVVATQGMGAARSTTPPPPRPSTVFGSPRRAIGTGIDGPPALAALPAALPTPLVDPDDPAAAVLAPVGAAAAADKLDALAELGRMGLDTEESRRLTVLARAEAGDLDGARAAADAYRVDGEPGWAWADAVLAAARGDAEATARAAETVVDALPGEPAAWLLAAVAAEHRGAAEGDVRGSTPIGKRSSIMEAARRRHELVWRTDHGWIDAAFGLARTRLAAGDRAGAVAALDEVPPTSVHYVDAQVAAVRVALAPDGGADRGGLLDAGRRCDGLDLDAARRAELECEVLEAARSWLGRSDETGRQASATSGANGTASGGGTGGELLGCPLDERGLGFGLESRYRTRARYAPDSAARIALVDRANDARPWTRV